MKKSTRKPAAASTPQPWIVPTSRLDCCEPLCLIYSLDECGDPDKLYEVEKESMALHVVAHLRAEGVPAVAMRIERLEMSKEPLAEAEIQKGVNDKIERDRRDIHELSADLRGFCTKRLADTLDGLAITNLRMKIIDRFREWREPNRRKAAKAKRTKSAKPARKRCLKIVAA